MTLTVTTGRGSLIPLPVVTVSVIGVQKHRAMMVSGLTLLWYSRDTNSMIKIKHTKHHERIMRSNTVEYGTAVELYCTMHDVKLLFCIPEFSIIKIIEH